MKKQVFIVHGGDTFGTYDEYLNFLKTREIDFVKYGLGLVKSWQDNLQERLGEEFQVIRPNMPSKWNAKYVEWEIWFERFFPFLSDEVMLVGSSLGGSFLAKYLSEKKFPKKIKALFLVAGASQNNEPEWKLYDFLPPENLDNVSGQAENIFIYHSKDDPVVPFSQAEVFQKLLPKAKLTAFEDRGHFHQSEFPELTQDIISLS